MTAAAARGESVSISNLKLAIVQALKILMTKSDTEPQTSKEDIVQNMT
jgi:hypothetical protein